MTSPLFKIYSHIFVVTWERKQMVGLPVQNKNEGYITVASEQEARKTYLDFKNTHDTKLFVWYSTGFMKQIA